MVDSEYSMDTHKYMKISIGTVMRSPKMLKFFLTILKLKKYVRKLHYLLRYVPGQNKTILKAILENGGTLESLPDCYKNQEVCNKAVDDSSLMH